MAEETSIPYKGPTYKAPPDMPLSPLKENPYAPTAGFAQSLMHIAACEPIPEEVTNYLLNYGFGSKEIGRAVKATVDNWNSLFITNRDQITPIQTTLIKSVVGIITPSLRDLLCIFKGDKESEFLIRRNSLITATQCMIFERSCDQPGAFDNFAKISHL